MSTWGSWPETIHALEAQIKSQEKALDKKLTPASIDRATETGVFRGSKGETYTVTLNDCTCGSFRRTKMPCKHMYRLAMEIGAYPGLEYTSSMDVTSRIPVQKVLEMISGLTEEEQIEFAYFCYKCGKDNKYGSQMLEIGLAKKIDELGLVVITEDPEKFSSRRRNIRCTLPESIALDANSIHQAVHRKFPQTPDPLIFYY